MKRLVWPILGTLVLWPLNLVLMVGLFVPGLFVVGWLALAHAWELRASTVAQYGGRQVMAWTPAWAWLWGNEEDGVTGAAWYREKHPTYSMLRAAFQWSALRNFASNSRFIPWLNPMVEGAKIRYVGTADPELAPGGTHFAWQGPYTGLWVEYPFTVRGRAWRFQFRFGYRILPKLIAYPQPPQYLGFTAQPHVWRP